MTNKTPMILIAGLLALAGVFTDARPALAQTDTPPAWAEACGAPPAGVDINALSPSTTAQQAAADSNLLDDSRGLRESNSDGQTLLQKNRFTLVVSSGRKGAFGVPVPPTLCR